MHRQNIVFSNLGDAAAPCLSISTSILFQIQPSSFPQRFPQLLTDTLVSAFIVSWAALVPLAVVGLHRLPVGRLVGDPVAGTTLSDRKL